VITYQGITIRANYFVVDINSANLVRSVGDLKVALLSQKNNIFIYNTGNVVYDMTAVDEANNKTLNANLTTALSNKNINIIGIPNQESKQLPVMVGLSITVDVDKTISFSNIKFTNKGTATKITETNITSPSTTAATTATPGKVKFESCVFEAIVPGSYGIETNANIVNHEITNCQFINTEAGYYETVMFSSGCRHPYFYGTDAIVRNTTIRGSFGYVFASSSYGKFENNTIEYIDQTLNPYKAYKQPVAFHATPIGYGSQAYKYNGTHWVEEDELYNAFQLVIKNNKFINLENVFRIYGIDRFNLSGKTEEAHYSETIVFQNNELENCSFLVNKSTNAWSSNLASYLISCLTRDGKPGGYVNTERFVIQMNTGLTRNEQPLVIDYTPQSEGDIITGNFRVVSGLDYQEKYTTSPDFLYKFEGRYGTEVDGEKVYNFYLSKGNQLYTIESSASLDGLDKRVITEVDINSTQGADAYTFFFGDGE